MTSATLSVNGNFNHFTHALGLFNSQVYTSESPFDYFSKAVLYVPNDLPAPQQEDYHTALLEHLLPLLEVNPGGCMILCTALSSVDKVAAWLEDYRQTAEYSFTILKQGDKGKSALLETFRKAARAILVASASFWEGVDIPGNALTMVVIDRLPFSPPDDPIVEARVEASKRRGGNPFMEFQIPEAAIQLKQGVGRLIRSESDWGVLVVADARLVDKKYGRLLWQGLPNFQRTRSLEKVLAFIAQQNANLPAAN